MYSAFRPPRQSSRASRLRRPAIDAAAEAAAKNVAPADDLHADEAYRRDVTATLTQRMFRIACARAGLAIAE